jgi:hypothetical protein
MRRSPEYRTWMGMKARCGNPNDKRFADYGGRGIRVCDRWLESFEAFLADMGPRPSSRHTIDRIDVDGGYEPGNCRWVAAAAQARNKRTNRIEEYRGVRASVAELCERFGADVRRVYWRIERGWTIADAIERPPRIWPNQRHRRAR